MSTSDRVLAAIADAKAAEPMARTAYDPVAHRRSYDVKIGEHLRTLKQVMKPDEYLSWLEEHDISEVQAMRWMVVTLDYLEGRGTMADRQAAAIEKWHLNKEIARRGFTP